MENNERQYLLVVLHFYFQRLLLLTGGSYTGKRFNR